MFWLTVKKSYDTVICCRCVQIEHKIKNCVRISSIFFKNGALNLSNSYCLLTLCKLINRNIWTDCLCWLLVIRYKDTLCRCFHELVIEGTRRHVDIFSVLLQVLLRITMFLFISTTITDNNKIFHFYSSHFLNNNEKKFN